MIPRAKFIPPTLSHYILIFLLYFNFYFVGGFLGLFVLFGGFFAFFFWKERCEFLSLAKY